MIRKILVDNNKSSKDMLAKYAVHIADREKKQAARGENCRRGSRSGSRGGGGNAAKAQRATSSERPPPGEPMQPPPVSPTPPPSPPPHPQPPQTRPHFNFPDTQDLSSDSNDDESFDMEYGNNVYESGSIVPKNNANSTSYSSHKVYHLPFGGHPNPTALK